MSSWRVLDFTGFTGTLDATPGHLVARYADGSPPRTAALVDVHTVLVGEDTNVTSAAVRAAGRHGVSLLFCDWRGVPVTAAAGFSSHTLAGERQRGQVTLSVPRRKQAWAAVVRAKITGQANLLRKIGDSEGDAALRSLVGAESPRVL